MSLVRYGLMSCFGTRPQSPAGCATRGHPEGALFALARVTAYVWGALLPLLGSGCQKSGPAVASNAPAAVAAYLKQYGRTASFGGLITDVAAPLRADSQGMSYETRIDRLDDRKGPTINGWSFRWAAVKRSEILLQKEGVDLMIILNPDGLMSYHDAKSASTVRIPSQHAEFPFGTKAEAQAFYDLVVRASYLAGAKSVERIPRILDRRPGSTGP